MHIDHPILSIFEILNKECLKSKHYTERQKILDEFKLFAKAVFKLFEVRAEFIFYNEKLGRVTTVLT